MKFLRKITCLILCAVCALCLTCCSFNGVAVDFYYFNTSIHVEVHDFALSKTDIGNIEKQLSDLENEFDVHKQTSFLAKFNSADKDTALTLSPTAKELVLSAKKYYEFTNGLFDPTVYPLVKLWQFSPNYPVQTFSPPTLEQIAQVLPHVGFSLIELSKDNSTITKKDSLVQMDFGAFLKGYACDQIADTLKSLGHKKGYVNVGGSSLNLLEAPSLLVRHPRATENCPNILSIDTLSSQNLSVSTSGDYEKYYTYNQKKYTHVINPLTGMTADTGVSSVTVLGGDGVFNDIVTTTACLLEHTPSEVESSPLVNFLKLACDMGSPHTVFFAVYENDKQIITNQQDSSKFTVLDKQYELIIV